jgi:hypothetical protein
MSAIAGEDVLHGANCAAALKNRMNIVRFIKEKRSN